MKIGVFDSGIGGEAIARDLRSHFTRAEIVIVSDKAHVPYGSKSDEEIILLSRRALQPLLRAHCEIIVIACNTVTAVALSVLRHEYPNQTFVGIEPMVKTAAARTKTGVITVCATPATLRSHRYKSLKDNYARDITICEPDCSRWAAMIEHDAVAEDHIRATIEPSLAQRADVVVLGCTHYHWIRDLIEKIVSERAIVIDPTESIAHRITQLMP